MPPQSMALDHVVQDVHDAEASVRLYESVLNLCAVSLDACRSGNAGFPSCRINRSSLIDFFPRTLWETSTRPRIPNHLCLAAIRRFVQVIRKRLHTLGVRINRQTKCGLEARGLGVSLFPRHRRGNGGNALLRSAALVPLGQV